MQTKIFLFYVLFYGILYFVCIFFFVEVIFRRLIHAEADLLHFLCEKREMNYFSFLQIDKQG